MTHLNNPLIHTQLEGQGLLIATIDMPGRSMNVFSDALMDALEALMDRVDHDAEVQAVVLTSAKASFLAGADLAMVGGFTASARTLDEEQLFALCGRLGRLFVRLEASAKPYVAAVNGLALGGGLELAMACRERIVADDPRLQLGLPEVRWGLLPGAGGTQRLPRLAGFEPGLSLLLSGRALSPSEALELNVVRQVVPVDRLLAEAGALALSLRGKPHDPKVKYRHLDQGDVPPHTEETVHRLAQVHGVSAEQFANYPAYRTIIDCVLLGARQPLAEASATEMRQFIHLMIDPVAGHMIRSLFLNRQQADKALAAPNGLRIEDIVHGPITGASQVWSDALARSRVTVRQDASLPPDRLHVTDSRGRAHVVQAGSLASVDVPTSTALAILTPPGPYGRVLEIIGADPSTADALAALAPRLGGALPCCSGNGASVLRRLQAAGERSLDDQAVLALKLLDDGTTLRAEFLDVAALAAGIAPAYTGGPLTYLWQHRERLVPDFDSTVQAAWRRQVGTLQAAFD